MAEINVADLPVTPSSEWSDNDSLLVVNDGSAQRLQRPTLLSWIKDNVQGEKGDQGIQGVAGKDGANGTNGISATHSWNGTTLTITSASGTSSANLIGASGTNGTNGSNGTNGWSPVFSLASDGDRRVLRVIAWVGGTGTSPTTGQYVGTTGLVNTITSGVDIRGVQGLTGATGNTGATGATGANGADGADGKTVTQASFQNDGSLKLTYNDSTSITSTNSNNNTVGWGSYKDGQYTEASPYNIPINTTIVLPNNSATVIETKLPDGVTTFYNSTTQKYALSDVNGLYSVRVRFKVAGGTTSDYLNITFSKDTTETPFSEDRLIRGDSLTQEINFSTIIYGDSPLATNGMTIRLKTNTRAVSISAIEVVIAKLI